MNLSKAEKNFRTRLVLGLFLLFPVSAIADVDILGIKLGMTPEEFKSASEKALGKNARIREIPIQINSFEKSEGTQTTQINAVHRVTNNEYHNLMSKINKTPTVRVQKRSY